MQPSTGTSQSNTRSVALWRQWPIVAVALTLISCGLGGSFAGGGFSEQRSNPFRHHSYRPHAPETNRFHDSVSLVRWIGGLGQSSLATKKGTIDPPEHFDTFSSGLADLHHALLASDVRLQKAALPPYLPDHRSFAHHSELIPRAPPSLA